MLNNDSATAGFSQNSHFIAVKLCANSRLRGLLSALGLAALSACSTTETTPTLPVYLDTNFTTQQRVDDLVSRMTLEEKVLQMQNQSPAIERLGITEYNWWSEGLHGVARAGLATVFPQAIGLAATWNEELMLNVATVISDEARAKHHAAARENQHHFYQGLTLWSPNINIFRDPRWGRGQETYGEDPFLTGSMAVQFIKGLQGDDENYLKTVATVKHFAVHNGPEPERHSFDAKIDDRDLYQNYLPQFEMALKEGGAQSLMCAYNRVNGEPACASTKLLEDILRNDWGFEGFVVSDCGAIEDIHKHHKVTESPEQSAAVSVIAGTDLNCGSMYKNLTQATTLGLITEQTIDKSVKRLFTARMQLGMFDSPLLNSYANIPYSVVDSEGHQQLALQAARESIVLLKNQNNLLPLKKDLKSIAVIGPNADQWLMLQGNYIGLPSNPITPLEGIKKIVSPNTRVLYAQGSDLAEGVPLLDVIPASVFSHAQGAGLEVEYFNQASFNGEPAHREIQQNIDINWQEGSPKSDMNNNNFAVRWKGKITPQTSGRYKLSVLGTCKTSLTLDGKTIVTPIEFADELSDPRPKTTDWLQLTANRAYDIEVTAIDTFADARVQLQWAMPEPNLKEQAISIAKKADAVILFMGLTPTLEGEEMDVKVDGFKGGDRTSIHLPAVQEQLIKDIAALGKPTVLVTLNGSALAINWANDNIPAIIEAWYPGQAGGDAIAEVLFGDYNPAGRLPITFYNTEADLPPFEDYVMSTQTYRYFKGKTLYPFGHGLSYSQFNYSNLVAPQQAALDTDIQITVTVENTSSIKGDEVVQAYMSKNLKDDRTPIRSLVGFKRITLPPHSKQTVTLNIAKAAFNTFDAKGKSHSLPGKYTLSVGGGQPQQAATTSGKVLSHTVTLTALPIL